MKKSIVLWMGAGQIGMAIARRIGHGKKIVVGDKSADNARSIAKTMTDAGFDVVWMEADLSSRESILALIAKCQEFGAVRSFRPCPVQTGAPYHRLAAAIG